MIRRGVNKGLFYNKTRIAQLLLWAIMHHALHHETTVQLMRRLGTPTLALLSNKFTAVGNDQ
jgi:hypothetical protein